MDYADLAAKAAAATERYNGLSEKIKAAERRKAEHESEILLHQAAKKAFDGLGLKKLPTVKSLQAEYAALLAEKKSAYADYRRARDEMKELLTVKANVDRLIGYDKSETDMEVERQEER